VATPLATHVKILASQLSLQAVPFSPFPAIQALALARFDGSQAVLSADVQTVHVFEDNSKFYLQVSPIAASVQVKVSVFSQALHSPESKKKPGLQAVEVPAETAHKVVFASLVH